MTETPDTHCPHCGDTGYIPPFMDACSCERLPLPEPSIPPPAPTVMQATIPGTTIPTPGFPDNPEVGDTCLLRHEVFAWNGEVWVGTGGWHADEEFSITGDGTSDDDVLFADDVADLDQIEEDAVMAASLAKIAAAEEAFQALSEAAVAAEEGISAVADVAGALFGGEHCATCGEDIVVIDTDGTWAHASGYIGNHAISPAVLDTTSDTGYVSPAEAWGWDKSPADHDHTPLLPAIIDSDDIVWDSTASVDELTATVVDALAKPPAKPAVKMASSAQLTLLGRLIAERDPTYTLVANATTELATAATGFMSAKRASNLIDGLLHLPTDPSRKPHRPNKYTGTCRTCKGNVDAGAGRIEQETSGRWVTYHLDGGCLTAAEIAVADADRVDEPGLYRHETGTATIVYRVRPGRTSKRLYGEKIVTSDRVRIGDDGITPVMYTHVEFVYNANAMQFLRRSNKLTWAEARDFGALYGACVSCGRTLSDPRSVVQMYGSTCAGHYGWPTVTIKQAKAIIAGTVTWDEVTGAALL